MKTRTAKKKAKKARRLRIGEITPECGTPTEIVYALAMGWLKLMLEGKTADLADIHPPSFEKKVRKAMIELYNQLLDKSKMDGTYLEYEE
jgi:hypothetical protein